MPVDKTNTHIFIWVPGTGGHEVHPSFKREAIKATKGDCTFVCVKYPASIDFIGSVQVGIDALIKTLIEVYNNKEDYQKVYLGGSSQGSWVIGDCLFNNPSLLELATKVVLFGGPGISESHDFQFFYEDKVWEIDNPNDAVTFGWDTEDRDRIALALSDISNMKLRGFSTFFRYMFKKPSLLGRLFVLIILHTKITNWITSPHDYSNQMPLALYWMLH